jgi:hypothetical protein
VVDETSLEARQARNKFAALDSDGDGSVSTEEWARSRQLKPLFEAAGVDLSQPMSADQFVMNYVRITAPKG